MACADTHGDHAVLSTAGLEFVEHLDGELGTGAPQRVTQGDGTTVHIDGMCSFELHWQLRSVVARSDLFSGFIV